MKHLIKVKDYGRYFVTDGPFFQSIQTRLIKSYHKGYNVERGHHDSVLEKLRKGVKEGKVLFEPFTAPGAKRKRTAKPKGATTMPSNEIVLKDLCKEFDIDPPKLRRLLRSQYGVNNKWRWEPDSKKLKEVRKFIGDTLCPAEAEEKPAAKKSTKKKAGTRQARKGRPTRTSTAATTKGKSSGQSASATRKRRPVGSGKSSTSSAKKTSRKRKAATASSE